MTPSLHTFKEEEGKKFDERSHESFAKDGFLTTDLDGSWVLDETAIKKFLHASNQRAMLHILERVKEEVGEEINISIFPECIEEMKGRNAERSRMNMFLSLLTQEITEIQ